MPSQCCRCNGNGRCRGCVCVRGGRTCTSCTPSRSGRCENFSTVETGRARSTAELEPPARPTQQSELHAINGTSSTNTEKGLLPSNGSIETGMSARNCCTSRHLQINPEWRLKPVPSTAKVYSSYCTKFPMGWEGWWIFNTDSQSLLWHSCPLEKKLVQDSIWESRSSFCPWALTTVPGLCRKLSTRRSGIQSGNDSTCPITSKTPRKVENQRTHKKSGAPTKPVERWRSS